jgi:cytochrome c1
MIRLKILIILSTAFAALAFAIPALAGGWAVITLDELPGQGINAEEPLDIGFTVRQHGIRPMEGLTPTIHASQQDTGESFTVGAKPAGRTGHYEATLNFPSSGTWNWTIQAFSMNQAMPPLTVLPAVMHSQVAQTQPLALPMAAGLIGVTATVGGLLVLLRKRARWAVVLAIAGVFVSGFAFATAAGRNSPVPEIQTPSDVQAATGQDLFIAKGCTTCHSHADIPREQDTIYIDSGPDLTKFTASPEYLHRWLSDPASVKPAAEMPNLELSEAEIDSLIAFLSAK